MFWILFHNRILLCTAQSRYRTLAPYGTFPFYLKKMYIRRNPAPTKSPIYEKWRKFSPNNSWIHLYHLQKNTIKIGWMKNQICACIWHDSKKTWVPLEELILLICWAWWWRLGGGKYYTLSEEQIIANILWYADWHQNPGPLNSHQHIGLFHQGKQIHKHKANHQCW